MEQIVAWNMIKDQRLSEGLLEKFLTVQRCKMANRLIEPQYRQGRILDVGCGSYPFFLFNTQFLQKFGLDRLIREEDSRLWQKEGMTFYQGDLEKQAKLPFDDNYMDVITMLAVLEHIEPANLIRQLAEMRRIMKPGGMLILTTPAPWSDPLLNILSAFKLINTALYHEHKDTYNFSKIMAVLEKAGFAEKKIRLGYFEFFLNIWTTAKK